MEHGWWLDSWSGIAARGEQQNLKRSGGDVHPACLKEQQQQMTAATAGRHMYELVRAISSHQKILVSNASSLCHDRFYYLSVHASRRQVYIYVMTFFFVLVSLSYNYLVNWPLTASPFPKRVGRIRTKFFLLSFTPPCEGGKNECTSEFQVFLLEKP